MTAAAHGDDEVVAPGEAEGGGDVLRGAAAGDEGGAAVDRAVGDATAEGAERIREAYADDTWRRLTALGTRMDPDNLFRHNQNVPPAGS